MNDLSLGAALTLGLLGGSHCLVMCGGIGSALGMGVAAHHRYRILLLFQLGRISSYTLLGGGLGALLGLLGTGAGHGLPVLRVLSGVLLISMGCYLSNWWRGLQVLERLGQRLWRLVQPLTARLLPVQRVHHAFIIGLCWGLLPCGLIYTALAWSATAASAQQSALLMFCFGLGTVPVMFATGAAGEKLALVLRHRGLRGAASLLLIGFGLWTLVSLWQPPGVHQHHSTMDKPATSRHSMDH
jgi:sulfite exporter TauE/SafE